MAASAGGRAAGQTGRRRTPEALGQLGRDAGEGVVQGVGYGVIGAGLAATHNKLGQPSPEAGRPLVSGIERNAFYRQNVTH